MDHSIEVNSEEFCLVDLDTSSTSVSSNMSIGLQSEPVCRKKNCLNDDLDEFILRLNPFNVWPKRFGLVRRKLRGFE